MKSEILEQTKNPFFNRENIKMKIISETTPTKEEVKTEIGKDPELTIIQHIRTGFGNQEFLVEAQVYDNKESRDKYEVIPKKIRIQMEKEKKEAEAAEKKRIEEEKAAAEAAKAEEEKAKETPVEENTEETTVKEETGEKPADEKVEEIKEEEKTE